MLIGAGAKILGNIEVGGCSRVAAGSVVLQAVPRNTTVAGVPARVVGEAGAPSRRGRWISASPKRTAARKKARPQPPSEPKGEDVGSQRDPEAGEHISSSVSTCRRSTVRQRPQKANSAEVYIGDEFIGVVFRDDEDGDLSYNFTMAILDIDLE